MEKQESIVTNIDDIDIEELDRKFEMMSRECADSMTGTGTGLVRSEDSEDDLGDK